MLGLRGRWPSPGRYGLEIRGTISFPKRPSPMRKYRLLFRTVRSANSATSSNPMGMNPQTVPVIKPASYAVER